MRRTRTILAVAAITVVGLIAIGRYGGVGRTDRSSTAALTRSDAGRLPSVGGDTAASLPETGAPAAPEQPAASGATLSAGEYACVGSGGSILAGLGFKVDASGGYTDLDNTTRGTVSVSGTDITFTGGHFDGTPGRNYNGKSFVVGSMASCEKWS